MLRLVCITFAGTKVQHYSEKVLNKILKIALPLIFGAAILWWMYRGFDWQTLHGTLVDEMSWTWMLLSFPFGILAQVFRGIRWRQVLQPMGENPRISTCVNAVFLSYASSLVIPRVGEVLRCGVLKRYDGIGFTRGVGTVVTERVIDMVIIAILSLFVVVAQLPVFFNFVRETGLSLSSLTGRFTTVGWAVTVTCVIFILAMGFWLIRRARILSRTRDFLQDLISGLLSIRKVASIWLFLIYSLAIWVCYFLHFYLTFFCFEFTESLSINVAVVAFVVGTFAVIVPTPNGAGPWHFAVKTVLMLYGVKGSEAAIFALLVHSIQTLLVAALGVYSAAALGLTKPLPAKPV